MVVGTCNIDEFVDPDDSVMLVGIRFRLKPAREMELFKSIVPVKPPRLVRLIVDVTVPPWVRVMDVGFADIAKSGTALVEKIAV